MVSLSDLKDYKPSIRPYFTTLIVTNSGGQRTHIQKAISKLPLVPFSNPVLVLILS